MKKGRWHGRKAKQRLGRQILVLPALRAEQKIVKDTKKSKTGSQLGNKERVFLDSEGVSGWSVSQAALAAPGTAKVSN